MIEDAFPRIAKNNIKVALVDSDGAHTYDSINARIALFAAGILEDRQDLQEERIAFLIPASLNYVTALLGIWRAGGIAVPLNISSAEAELEHYLGSIGGIMQLSIRIIDLSTIQNFQLTLSDSRLIGVHSQF